jgi:DNA-binding MarR family transcriptional regulator
LVEPSDKTADEHSTAITFGDTVVALRRATRRVVRSGLAPGDGVPPSESELLSLVARVPGVSIKEAANQLDIAQNTVSTLVRALRSKGLLERRSRSHDRRVASLHLTSRGARRSALVRKRRNEVLTQAMDSLTTQDRQVLEQALPTMRRLLHELEAMGSSTTR